MGTISNSGPAYKGTIVTKIHDDRMINASSITQTP